MKPGDRVICINDKNLYHVPVRNICEGIIYTLTEVFTCACGNVYVRLAEVNITMNMWCPKCNKYEDTKMYFHIHRFQKLDKSVKKEKESTKDAVPVSI